MTVTAGRPIAPSRPSSFDTEPPSKPEGIIEVAIELASEAARLREVLDTDRRLPEPLYQAAAAHGLFRQLVPAELGGLASEPVDWFRLGVEMARREPSFGWVVSQGAAELAWLAVGGDPTWAREVLADPHATSASTTAGVGRLRVEGDTATFGGRWSFDTGCPGADWIGGLAVVDGAESPSGLPDLRLAWVPAAQASIVEDWDPIGLRGSGSHSVLIDEQEIPVAWTVAWTEPTDHPYGPYRTVVGNGNWPIAGAVAATQLGVARRALDEATQIVQTKAPAPAFVALSQNAAVQRELVALEGEWRGAVAAVECELARLWREASIEEHVSIEQRVRCAIAHVTANRVAVSVVDRLAALTGTAVVARTGVLGRCLLDVHALAGHIATGGTVAERAAQLHLGLIADDFLV